MAYFLEFWTYSSSDHRHMPLCHSVPYSHNYCKWYHFATNLPA